MNKKISDDFSLWFYGNDSPSETMYIVAVSGGVDSVVLLDATVKQFGADRIIVAHVHHGIRPESDEEFMFVEGLARQYGVAFEGTRLGLGAETSEELARNARYDFLRRLAKKYDAPIVTAHHADDIIETIVLHLQRGTGWRGLSVMGAKNIWRPLAWYFKKDILVYAQKHELEWREDKSNVDSRYARNRVRPLVSQLPDNIKQEVLALWHSQRELAREIDEEARSLLSNSRHFYIMVPARVAREVLRAYLLRFSIGLTRPQLDSALLSIKTAKPGTLHSLDNLSFLSFRRDNFILTKKNR